MRCLALAQAWQELGGAATFVYAELPDQLAARLVCEGFQLCRINEPIGSIEDAVELIRIAGESADCRIVVDGYGFTSRYQQLIKNSGLWLLFVDDNGHCDYYCADIVLNQNLHAHEKLYAHRAEYTRLLLGTNYVLLRREFRERPRTARQIPAIARRILVTFGGSDSHNVTAQLIRALDELAIDKLEVVAIAGAANQHVKELQEIAAASTHDVRVLVDPPNVAELMDWAELAISAAGSTCWELCYYGVPCVLVVTASNQLQIAEHLSDWAMTVANVHQLDFDIRRLTAAVYRAALDQSRRRKASEMAIARFDGEGASRIVSKVMLIESRA